MGVILYELLVGIPPFNAEHPQVGKDITKLQIIQLYVFCLFLLSGAKEKRGPITPTGNWTPFFHGVLELDWIGFEGKKPWDPITPIFLFNHPIGWFQI